MHIVHAEPQPITRAQDIQLFVGDTLIVRSDQNSIQRVFLQGNLTAANLTKPAQYPANKFELTAFSSETYNLRVLFDLQTDYKVNLYVQPSDQSKTTNSTSYYLSGGPSESPWESLVNWIGKFGEAFPLWVKLLYFALGIQFFAVGGLCIRRETAKRESGLQRLDVGDKAFLWLDIAYKFLLTSFVALVLIMGGELLILFILRFMFLVSLDLLSLWDLFVVGFAVGVVTIVYLIRFTFEKIFDMKPVEDE